MGLALSALTALEEDDECLPQESPRDRIKPVMRSVAKFIARAMLFCPILLEQLCHRLSNLLDTNYVFKLVDCHFCPSVGRWTKL